MPPPTPSLTQDDPAERKSRHLDLAQDLQQMAMSLTRSAFVNAAAQLEAPPPDPDQPRQPDHALTFTRLSRVVQFAMILEARAAHDALARGPRPRLLPQINDARRPLLRQALHQAIKSGPDLPAAERAERRREIDHHIDQELTADPTHQSPAADLLGKLATSLDIEIDPKNLSDELLGLPARNLYRTAIQPTRPGRPLNL